MASKSDVKVAVVTGANKGIGLEIVKSLCRHFGQDGVVYLTARNEGRGLAAVEVLRKEGLNPRFHILDVTDQSSIDTLRDHLEKEHGGIDILINNAGIGTSHNLPLYEKSLPVVKTNFFAVLAVCRSLMPLVRQSGRIVNIASTTGYIAFREQLDEDLKNRFRQVKDEEDLVALMNEYLQSCKEGTIEKNRWPDKAYGIAKLGVIVWTKIQAKRLSEQEMTRGIHVNACCPGFVSTDLTAHLPANHYGGTKITTVEGVDTPVFLALLPPGADGPNGEFLLRRKSYDFLHTDVTIDICE
ncbi:carbonyl reductase [NADPH] 1-like isoform X1 [Lytechinus variegatus]|uniref:carbonyl reductase [NADPH] 1-like isoform X1 n=1 Tax=Lytechinus variegatus TaxID=7654 RepID=UPI001BB10CCB|nr:carbonyl reductase [NADPH] 1-like isoform X1 [Lytechinus variegatus]